MSFVQKLLRTIVSADLPRIKQEIDSCIRRDASMDQTQKDNEYMLLNTVDQDLKFIGIEHVTESRAAGHLQALKTCANDTVGYC